MSLAQQDNRLPQRAAHVLSPEADAQPRHEESDEQEIMFRQPTDPDLTKDHSSPGLLFLIAPALLAGIIVKAFDIAFLATSYSRIASDLGHFKDGPWIMLTASICSAVFVPMYSYMLKSFGMKRMMIAANTAFALGAGLWYVSMHIFSLRCALSTSFWQLLGSRLVLGFGSSGITLLSMIVINEIVGIKQLAIWESFVTCIEMGTSMAAGPLGAWISRRFSWHPVFLLELSFAAIGVGVLFVSFAKINSNPQYSRSKLLESGDSKVPRVDVEGWILLVLAVTIPLISVALGDNYLGWTHPAEILLLVCGPVFWCLFVLFEIKKAKAPIINMTPVFEIQYLRVLFQVFFVISTLNSIVVIIPPYIQVRAFDGPSFEDWALTCVFLGFSVGAIIGGYLVKSTSLGVQRIMLVNSVLLLCFCVLFATRVIKPESARYAPLLVGFGMCTGAWQSCLLYATLKSTRREWWPQTLALYYLIETFGADLGMALMSTITRSVTKSGIRSSLGDSETTERVITDALRDLQSLKLLDHLRRDKVLTAFEHAMHTSFFLPCSMAAAVLLLAASMNFRLQSFEPSYDELPQADNEDEYT